MELLIGKFGYLNNCNFSQRTQNALLCPPVLSPITPNTYKNASGNVVIDFPAFQCYYSRNSNWAKCSERKMSVLENYLNVVAAIVGGALNNARREGATLATTSL